jgi:hypothetical protein
MTMPPTNPHRGSGYLLAKAAVAMVAATSPPPADHPVPPELTEEGLLAAAMRVPSDAELNKAADSVIAEITGANVPSGTPAELTDEELEAATAPK